MENMPIHSPITFEIERYPTGEKLSMHSLDKTQKVTESDLERIVTCCNQEAIFNFIFKDLFGGRPYMQSDAEFFVKWANEGWEKGTWYVFIVRDEKGKILGAIDIKSNNLKRAEIGYWASVDGSGFMTNATKKLCDFAEKNGYTLLYAHTLPHNDKSSSVLKRAGFQDKGLNEVGGKSFRLFEKALM